MLSYIVTSYGVKSPELASALSDVFIYIHKDKRYLAISTRVMRSVARQFLGVTSMRKLKEILERYHIVKKQLRLQGEKGYFYLVRDYIFERLTNIKFDEFLETPFEQALDMGGREE